MLVATSKIKSMNTRVLIHMSRIQKKFNIKVFLPFPDCFDGHCDRFHAPIPSLDGCCPIFFVDEQLALGMVGHDLFGSGG